MLVMSSEYVLDAFKQMQPYLVFLCLNFEFFFCFFDFCIMLLYQTWITLTLYMTPILLKLFFVWF